MRKRDEENLREIAANDKHPQQMWAHGQLRKWLSLLQAPKPPAPANTLCQPEAEPKGRCVDCGAPYYTTADRTIFNNLTNRNLEAVCYPCAEKRWRKSNSCHNTES